MNINKKIKEEIQREGLIPRKQKGQNFLTDGHAIGEIVKALDLHEDDRLVEIGPGTGQLTEHLFERNKNLKVVELDRRMATYLEEKFPGIQITRDDVLKLDWKEFFPGPYKLVGNLPYYITTPILEKIVWGHEKIQIAVIMIQYEVGKRLLAKPGTKEYGRLSLFVNNYYEINQLKKVSGRMFYPPVKVSSVILSLVPRRKTLISPELYEVFYHLVKGAFTQRRKNIFNCLKSYPYFLDVKDTLPDLLEKAGIDPKRRGETMDFNEFDKLSDVMNKAMKHKQGGIV